jgi:hypothetical protein
LRVANSGAVAHPHQITGFTSGRIFSFSWSRDGKQMIVARGSETSDVVLVSNFR